MKHLFTVMFHKNSQLILAKSMEKALAKWRATYPHEDPDSITWISSDRDIMGFKKGE